MRSLHLAAYARGSGSAALVFKYTVKDTDRDDNGISIPWIYPIFLSSEVSIRSSDGEDANLRHSGIGDRADTSVDAPCRRAARAPSDHEHRHPLRTGQRRHLWRG